jgi:hypothetical protein
MSELMCKGRRVGEEPALRLEDRIEAGRRCLPRPFVPEHHASGAQEADRMNSRASLAALGLLAVAALATLDYSVDRELETFAAARRASLEEFQADPSGPPLVPNWARVWAGVHDAGPQLLAAIREGPR